MKTIIFFDRCFLTHHFALMTKTLIKDYNVVHIASSDYEVQILAQNNITQNVLRCDIEIINIYNTEPLNFDLIKEIDDFYSKNTNGDFCLNSAIYCDRAKEILSYPDELHLAQSYYLFWKKILNNFEVACVLHETTSVLMNHICSTMCRSKNIPYLSHQWGNGDVPYSYYYAEYDTHSNHTIKQQYELYLSHPELIDKERCDTYIEKFKKSFDIIFSGQKHINHSITNLLIKSIKERILQFTQRNKYDKIGNNVDYWMVRDRLWKRRLRNAVQYKKRIKFEEMVPGEKYFYYSFHLEPEATISYLNGGWYVNQVKLIENIASSLPAGYYLYVKDHPHEYAYRDVIDYERLQHIPNVRLLRQDIPGKLVVKNAIGLFTINGTNGYEAILLGKPVFTFGKSYYSFYRGCYYIENVKDIKNVVTQVLGSDNNCSETLYAYLNAYFDALYSGAVLLFSDPSTLPANINVEENAILLSENLMNYLKKQSE